jgi:hypothetical protein
VKPAAKPNVKPWNWITSIELFTLPLICNNVDHDETQYRPF